MSNTITVDQFDLQRFAEWLGDQSLKFDGVNKWVKIQDRPTGSHYIQAEIWFTTEQLVQKWLKEKGLNG